MLSDTMRQALVYMGRYENRLERHPGGYWAAHEWANTSTPYWNTSTVEALVTRGLAYYSAHKHGKHGDFPIEVTLTEEGKLAANLENGGDV